MLPPINNLNRQSISMLVPLIFQFFCEGGKADALIPSHREGTEGLMRLVSTGRWIHCQDKNPFLLSLVPEFLCTNNVLN